MTAFVRRQWSDVEGWDGADHASALSAFRASAARLEQGSFPTGSLGIDAEAFAEAAYAALKPAGALGQVEARAFDGSNCCAFCQTRTMASWVTSSAIWLSRPWRMTKAFSRGAK